MSVLNDACLPIATVILFILTDDSCVISGRLRWSNWQKCDAVDLHLDNYLSSCLLSFLELIHFTLQQTNYSAYAPCISAFLRNLYLYRMYNIKNSFLMIMMTSCGCEFCFVTVFHRAGARDVRCKPWRRLHLLIEQAAVLYCHHSVMNKTWSNNGGVS